MQTNSLELEAKPSEVWNSLIEIEKCSQSPHYFLKTYGKILDATKGVINFEPWLHQADVLTELSKHRLVIILKARQIGMTWLMAAYALWKALFTEGGNVILLSKSEDASAETLSYIRFMHSQLPTFLQMSKGYDHSSLITFPAMKSKIRALPATSSAGIGFGQASLIVADEWDLWDNQEYVRRNYAEIKPMIDMAGQYVILSAVNKYDQETKFKEIYLKAKTRENNFHSIFLPYDVLPERDDTWYEAQKREYDQWELEGRYPKTEQEALSAPHMVCRFDIQALEDLRQRCVSPLREEYNGLVKIYQEPIAGKYCFVFDPSEGTESSDPCAGRVIDRWNEVVAEFHGRIPLDEQARIAWDLYQRYHQPFTAPERNASGLTLIEKMKDLGITNWYYCDNKRAKEGWWTSTGNRDDMIMDLADMVFHRSFREPNPSAIDEFQNFIRTKKKQAGEARGGAHDEYVMMWAIFFQIKKVMPVGGQKVITGKYTIKW